MPHTVTATTPAWQVLVYHVLLSLGLSSVLPSVFTGYFFQIAEPMSVAPHSATACWRVKRSLPTTT